MNHLCLKHEIHDFEIAHRLCSIKMALHSCFRHINKAKKTGAIASEIKFQFPTRSSVSLNLAGFYWKDVCLEY